MLLTDYNRNKPMVDTIQKNYFTPRQDNEHADFTPTINVLKLLHTIFGMKFDKPFLIKKVNRMSKNQFFRTFNKLSDTQENFLINFTNINLIRVVKIDVENREFLVGNVLENSMNMVDNDALIEVLRSNDNFLVVLPKKSRMFKELSVNNKKEKTKIISKFTNSKFLNNNIRVKNAEEVIDNFKETFVDIDEQVAEQDSFIEEHIDRYRQANPMASDEQIEEYLRNMQPIKVILKGMVFKDANTKGHYCNLGKSLLFRKELIDTENNLPLDKSGYNRYLFRRELARRLIEFKNDTVFSDYDNYQDVIDFKKAETNAKELYLKLIRSKSVSKLTHKRIKNVNLLANCSKDYAQLMQLLAKHYYELRLYRKDNKSRVYTNLDDVIIRVRELTDIFNKFIKTYKPFLPKEQQ